MSRARFRYAIELTEDEEALFQAYMKRAKCRPTAALRHAIVTLERLSRHAQDIPAEGVGGLASEGAISLLPASGRRTIV